MILQRALAGSAESVRRILLVLLFVSFAAPLHADESDRLLTIRKGDLPIILSAPHGGRLPIPEVLERKGDGINKFVVVRDDNTAELVDLLVDSIAKKLGGKPYVVIARFERKFLDVNRNSDSAFESPKAEPYYRKYHDALQGFCKEVKAEWGRGLLLDIHGQGAEAGAIFPGTQNGKTVKALLDRFGRKSLYGDDGFFGVLSARGFKIIPALDSTDSEDRRFNGGYIVATYGSHQGSAIDAVQLELGAQGRAKSALPKTAESLSAAIAAFHHAYLPDRRVTPKR